MASVMKSPCEGPRSTEVGYALRQRRLTIALVSMLITGLAGTALSPEATAAPELTVNNPDAEFWSVIESGPVAIDGAVSLTSSEAATYKVSLKAAKWTGDGLDNPLRHVTLPSSITFGQAGETRDLAVPVRDLAFPGTFDVEIEFQHDGAATVGASIHFDAYMKPVLKVTPEKVTLSLADCAAGWTCAFAEWMVPGSARREIVFTADNHSPGEVRLRARDWELKEAASDRGLAVRMKGQDIGFDSQGPIRLLLPAENLSPGSYSGNLRLQTVYAGQPRSKRGTKDGRHIEFDVGEQSVVATVNVRAGPVIPLLVIILGVAAGRLALRMGDPKTKEQLELYSQYLLLRDDIQAIPDVQVRTSLGFDLQRLHDSIDIGRKDKATIAAAVDALAERLAVYREIAFTEKEIAGLDIDPETARQPRELLEEAKRLLCVAEPGDAEAKIKEARDVLASCQPEAARELELLAFKAGAPLKMIAVGGRAVGPPVRGVVRERPGLKRTASTFAWIAGDKVYTPVETKYWVWRPIGFVVLMLALVFQGLVLNYVGDATLGAEGVADYAKLFMWGVGSEVATRTLQQIKF